MKHLISWKSVAISVCLVVLCAAPAAAQMPTIRADIPFAFSAGGNRLGAGEYRFFIDVSQGMVRITPEHGSGVWLVRLQAGASDRPLVSLDKGMLRFEKYGERYLLSELWRAGAVKSNPVMKSRLPKEYAQSVHDVSETR